MTADQCSPSRGKPTRSPWSLHSPTQECSRLRSGPTPSGQRYGRPRAAGDPDLGDTYYHHWVAALESLCVTRAGIDQTAIDECQRDWRHAYEHTPHGQPVERWGRTEQESGS